MRLTRLIARSLQYRWRTVLAVTAAAAVTCAVLTGALMARDSVRASLDRIVARRLGAIELAADTGDRFFARSLAERVQARSGAAAAAVLSTEGAVSLPGEDTRAGSGRSAAVAVYGVDSRFWGLHAPFGGSTSRRGTALELAAPKSGEVFINRRLAGALEIASGDTVIVRARRLDTFPAGAPLAEGIVETIAIRGKVKEILESDQLGDFSLRSNQIPPFNVFVDYDELASMMGLVGKANLFLSAKSSALNENISDVWALEDAGFEIVGPKNAELLIADRIFIDSEIVKTSEAVGGAPILTYFVDAIRSEGNSIPYSFVAGLDDDRIPPDLESDEIVLTRWAAEDLGVAAGDLVDVEYRMPEAETGMILVTHTRSFTVRAVVETRPADRDLMPKFPGFEAAENCRDWDVGVSIEFSVIRDLDEAYWDLYGGSPKAFLPLDSAKTLFENRYGSATAIHLPNAQIRERLLAEIGAPLLSGFVLKQVRKEGLESSTGGTDFGQLFLGLSMFLLIGAIVLTALIFSLSAEARRRDIATLSALGYTRKTILAIVLFEGVVISAVGGLVGCGVGILYNRIIIWGLRTIWSDAVRFTGLAQSIRLSTLSAGFLAGWATSFAALAWTARSIVASAPVEARLASFTSSHRRPPAVARIAAIVSAAAFVSLLIVMSTGGIPGDATTYLVLGGLSLVTILSCFVLVLRRSGSSIGRLTTPALAIKNAARRQNRSVAVATILAVGIFASTSVGANRKTVDMISQDDRSGTGGYDFVVTSAVPLDLDLGHDVTKSAYRIAFPVGTEIVGFRVRAGDDASCLNLNRVARPRLLGANPKDLAGTFSASEYADDYLGVDDLWSVLETPRTDGLIPAVADATVITWSLGKSVGDTIDYTDESGRVFTVLLAAGLENSVFQGNLIISNAAFRTHFPSTSGGRFFLVDGPPGEETPFESIIDDRLSDYGVTVQKARERLAEFYSVQNAYLAIFTSLGWIGILLGSIGLGIAVYRNVSESRAEFSLLSALGYHQGTVRMLARLEHVTPAIAGIIGGAVSAAVTTVFVAEGALSWLIFFGLIVLLAACAFLFIHIAVRLALPRLTPQTLREE